MMATTNAQRQALFTERLHQLRVVVRTYGVGEALV